MRGIYYIFFKIENYVLDRDDESTSHDDDTRINLRPRFEIRIGKYFLSVN